MEHALQNPAPQAPFANIGDFQILAIEQLSGIFSKVAANLNQLLDPPQKHPVTKSAPIPHKVSPTQGKPIPLEQPNIIEDDDGNSPTCFQRNVHISPSGPHIILPDISIPPPRVRPAQPTRMDTGGTRSKLSTPSAIC